ncbi:MAG: hypothetical protein QOH29_2622 [Actinomycetota bacterium]|nr:hypothetical protein [Actinomycetota bacterium]
MAVTFAVLVGCAPGTPSHSQRDPGSPSGPESTCSVGSCVTVDGVELIASNVDFDVAAAQNTGQMPSGQHYVAFDVSFVDVAGERIIDSSNLDPLSGVSLTPVPDAHPMDGSTGAAGIGLADEGGPVDGRTSTGSLAIEWHEAVGLGTRCALGTSSGEKVLGGGTIVENGPTRTLQAGDRYGPVRLCFLVGGPVRQRMSIVWAPAPFTDASAQPATQYLPVQR